MEALDFVLDEFLYDLDVALLSESKGTCCFYGGFDSHLEELLERSRGFAAGGRILFSLEACVRSRMDSQTS